MLFGLSPPLQATPRSRIVAYHEPNGDFTYGGPASPVYAVLSVLGQPAVAALRRAGAAAARVPADAAAPQTAQLEAWALRPYLRLPGFSARFYELADSLARPHATEYDRVVAVEQWLRREFRYTLELPRTEREATLEYFLFQRRAGHCEYFSTAMAMLLRAMGIPARNVNGFLGGEWNRFGDFLTVTQNQAHSWVEVWFSGYGWVRFDPTPPAAAGAGGGEAAGRWLTPLRLLFGGLEHRWGKWVLDYDLDDQGRLFTRATRSFRQAAAVASRDRQLPWRQLLAFILALVLVGGAVVRWRARQPHGAPGPRRSGVTRDYLRLRRAYARAGYDALSPPLAFLAELQQADAPGALEVADAVKLYARLRFGRPGQAGAVERRQLRRSVGAARRLLGATRRRR